MNVANK